MKTRKKGISLIVLVITIIVMIILATAIILSLNSSNISGKASEAKLSSDLANKKEAASVFLSEYEIKVAKGKIDKSTTTADAYVKSEMKKAGIDTADIAITKENDILLGTAALFANNNVPIGTVVNGYEATGKEKYSTSGNENVFDYESSWAPISPKSNDLTRDGNIQWQYFGIDENGKVLLVGSVTADSPVMAITGIGGYLYGPQELNNACKALYSSKAGTARSINIDDVVRVLEYTGERGCYMDEGRIYTPTKRAMTINEIAKMENYDMNDFRTATPDDGQYIGLYKSDAFDIIKAEDKSEYNASNAEIIYTGVANVGYWLASNCVRAMLFSDNGAYFNVRSVLNNEVSTSWMMFSVDKGAQNGAKHAIRPVVELNSNIQVAYEAGEVTLK